MSELLVDFPSGPLDFYRKKASFDWKKLKLFIFKEETIRYQCKVYEEAQKYDAFLPRGKYLNFDEQRYLSFKQFAILRDRYEKNEDWFDSVYVSSGESGPKLYLNIIMIKELIETLGDERHKHFVKKLAEGKISGCFALTEVGHGSNVKGMKTFATFDKNTKEFIINSPDFQAAKCWIGGLGTTSTHALLYAQLYLDNKNYGLHTFIVPIRDPLTLLPYPGIRLGDIGEKNGLNGFDNGFMMFNNYRIPRENLLNKNGDVTENGEYISIHKIENKRFGATLLTLSKSRIKVLTGIQSKGIHALTIAIRYAAIRKQFGPRNDKEEIAILEYPTHQYRLLPYLAAAFALKFYGDYLEDTYKNFQKNPIVDLQFVGKELHIITSVAKPFSTWIMTDAANSCRECCGAHGYLKASGLGDLKNNMEATQTYEGENWVLIQQITKFFLPLYHSINKNNKVCSPLKSVDFLSNAKFILETTKFSAKSVEELYQKDYIINIYDWLVSYLLKETYEQYHKHCQLGANKFSANNDIQVFYVKKLGIAYIERLILIEFYNRLSECSDDSVKLVLHNLFALFALFNIEKHLSTLYQGGYISGKDPATLIQDGITKLCGKLKNEAVALIDAVAPPDFVVDSILGGSNGKIYEEMEKSFLNSPYGNQRPKWWNEIVNWKEIPLKSKI